MVTIIVAKGVAKRAVDKIGHAEGFDNIEEYLDVCAVEVDSAIMAASTETYTLKNGLMKYEAKAKKSGLDELQGIIDREYGKRGIMLSYTNLSGSNC